MATNAKFLMQSGLSISIAAFCMWMLHGNPGAGDKALYGSQLASIVGWWMQSPGDRREQ